MLFGWAIEHGVTSNSVIYVKDGCTTAIGAGEQDRVGVAEIAIHKAYVKYADITCFDTHGIPYADSGPGDRPR
jgi:phosphoribosylaminoimidazolecarboxamide formyltransferase / IMP cyclohydrolase